MEIVRILNIKDSQPEKKRGPSTPLVPSLKTKSTLPDQTSPFLNSLLNSVSLNNIQAWINTLSSFHTRHSKSKLIIQVAEWIKSLLENFGYANVYFHDYLESRYQLKNVICDKKGISDRVILICAHFDCIMEDLNNAEERAPGADDNASGVAVVLELANLLSDINLRDSVKFAFFSGEEQGQWGSKKYAQHVKENNVNLYRLINLDMVGNPPSNQAVIIERDMGNKVSTNDEDSQNFGQIMEQMAANYTNLQVMLGSIYDSDYMPFEALGYVVAGVYDGGEANNTYHSKSDASSTINFGYAVSVAKIVLATIINETGVQGV
jgi:hypothetical protein